MSELIGLDSIIESILNYEKQVKREIVMPIAEFTEETKKMVNTAIDQMEKLRKEEKDINMTFTMRESCASEVREYVKKVFKEKNISN